MIDLQDTIAIQDYIRRQHNVSKLKWIVFGASYSAMKAVFHRIKYPNRFFAAYASSAPIGFRYEMPKYLAHVGDVLLDEENGGSQVWCLDLKVLFDR